MEIWPCLGLTGGGTAAFGCLSARRGPPPVGRAGGPSWLTSGSSWQQCRAGRVMATHTMHCARRAPGFGGGRLYCSHAPSHHRYMDADFEGTILTALCEPASWPTGRPHRPGVLPAAGYCSLTPNDKGFAEVSMATVPPSGGLTLSP